MHVWMNKWILMQIIQGKNNLQIRWFAERICINKAINLKTSSEQYEGQGPSPSLFSQQIDPWIWSNQEQDQSVLWKEIEPLHHAFQVKQ